MSIAVRNLYFFQRRIFLILTIFVVYPSLSLLQKESSISLDHAWFFDNEKAKRFRIP